MTYLPGQRLPVDPYAGMDAETIARCKASDATLAGTIANRRRVAQALLARGREAWAVRQAWEPIRQLSEGVSPVPAYTYPSLNPPPTIITEGGSVLDNQAPTTQTAGQTLSGHRAVAPAAGDTVVYADHANLADLGLPVWVTLGSAAVGHPVELAWFGTIVEPSWSWSIGPVFIGSNGLLVQTAPTTGYSRQIGTAVDTDTIWLDPQPGIALT